ncbi:phenylacetate--CoA ligase family protein [Arthrobacter sp. UYCu723]
MAWQESQLRVMVDLLRAQREGVPGLARRQEQRLAALVAQARTSSPFYRELYRGQPAGTVLLGDLPPVTKPQLMERFDHWVSDSGVTRAGVEAFVADPDLIGSRYRGKYFVCTSSGTTGHPGLFVHDAGAVAVYRAHGVRIARASVTTGTVGRLLALLQKKFRAAVVVGTGGHFAGVAWIESERRRSRGRRHANRVFSVQQPLARLVAGLNDFDPAILVGYPSALELLAEEHAAGRLHVRPAVVGHSGEATGEDTRAHLAAALGGAVHNVYAASEFTPIALDCARGWLHVNSDWVILEPVDAGYRPTPPGEPSHTVLLTNLANRVQPLIRYDLGDSVLARADPCECGSPLPAIRVSGRRDDVLRLDSAEGRPVSILPLAITAAVEDTPGVRRSQLLQSGPAAIRLRLDTEPGVDAGAVWRTVEAALASYLAGQGLSNVRIVRAAEPPEQSARSGKFRQVIARPRPN